MRKGWLHDEEDMVNGYPDTMKKTLISDMAKRKHGYAVLQNDLNQKIIPGLMFKNYLRYLSNALEMTRTRNRIIDISEHDLLTGLYNRR